MSHELTETNGTVEMAYVGAGAIYPAVLVGRGDDLWGVQSPDGTPPQAWYAKPSAAINGWLARRELGDHLLKLQIARESRKRVFLPRVIPTPQRIDDEVDDTIDSAVRNFFTPALLNAGEQL